tara:strand:+ start:608 stop:1036 length:429 start_codon:yes stop_codon:yes gene_type:complete
MAKKLTKKDDKKSKKTEAPKSSLDDLILADGKITAPSEDSDIKKIRELEEILGVKKVNPFGTYNLEIFKDQLSDMTNLDLQNLCEKIGVFASGSRMQIKEKLLREFKSVSRGTISMTNESPSVKLDPNNALHKRTLKILGEI